MLADVHHRLHQFVFHCKPLCSCTAKFVTVQVAVYFWKYCTAVRDVEQLWQRL